jgi:hypothetical protein
MAHIYTCTGRGEYTKNPLEKYNNMKVNTYLIIWRSVLRGIELLKKGIIWRIGDGRSVHICNDPWIPRGTTRRPCSNRGSHLIHRVNELIDPVTGLWNIELVKQTFHPEDVQIILCSTCPRYG